VECVNVASAPVISGKQQHIKKRFKATRKPSIYKSMVKGLKCLKKANSHIKRPLKQRAYCDQMRPNQNSARKTTSKIYPKSLGFQKKVYHEFPQIFNQKTEMEILAIYSNIGGYQNSVQYILKKFFKKNKYILGGNYYESRIYKSKYNRTKRS
jgi:hypothetical protein